MLSRNFFVMMIAVFLGGCASNCSCEKGCSCPKTGKKSDIFQSKFKQHLDKDSVGYYMESNDYSMKNMIKR